MKIKKIISSLLLIPIICSTCLFKSNAVDIVENNNLYDFKEITIKNPEINYKNISNSAYSFTSNSDISFGENTIAILSVQQNQDFFIISIFDNKSFEKQKEVTLNGYFNSIIEVNDGYLIFAVKNNSLFLYKISEYGNIIFDKKIIDSVDSVYVNISDIKVFKDNIAIIIKNEITLLSINGDFINKIKGVDLTGINDVEIGYIFDTGTNYIVLAGVATDSSMDTFFVNMSYDGLYQGKIEFPEGIVPMTISIFNPNEYISDFIDFNTNTYGLMKIDNNGNILSRFDYPSNIMSEHLNIFNNNIYSVGTEVDSLTFKTLAKLSEYDKDLNYINKYIINSKSITNSNEDYMFVALRKGYFTQDRIFTGLLSLTDILSQTTSFYLFSVDLDEVDAVNAIDIATTNPTLENIERARKLVNNLKESDKKEEFQNQLNEINVSMNLEKKTSTANLDVYIKSENMLSMNLSTNSITFNDYSGIDELEQQNAVEISINSSLPYQLNAYLLDEMYNSDKTKKIDMDRLNIKDNTDSDYKEFTAINEKLVLKDSCESGNDKSHSIYLKLKGGNAYESDIYKTVIKFEAEQK